MYSQGVPLLPPIAIYNIIIIFEITLYMSLPMASELLHILQIPLIVTCLLLNNFQI